MTKTFVRISFALLAVASIAVQANQADAQEVGPVINGQMIGGDPGPGPNGRAFPNPRYNFFSGVAEMDHPAPYYAHNRSGISATRTHHWNGAQATQHSWHGGYYHPQWGRPLSLVVPPTAAFQSVYGWGVGSTQSVPIYHQYSRESAGAYGPGAPGFHPQPYWPMNTQQFGVYYTRAPW